MWPSCNYSLLLQHSHGGRRLDIWGEAPVWQVTFWGWEIIPPARTKTSSLHADSNICLLPFASWGGSSESTRGALTRCEEQRPQAFSIFHLNYIIRTLTADPGTTGPVSPTEYKKPKTDKTDSYHTGWCAVMFSLTGWENDFSTVLIKVHEKRC